MTLRTTSVPSKGVSEAPKGASEYSRSSKTKENDEKRSLLLIFHFVFKLDLCVTIHLNEHRNYAFVKLNENI